MDPSSGFDASSDYKSELKNQELVVGAPRFELGTSCAQGRRATRLRYAPTFCYALILLHFWTLHPRVWVVSSCCMGNRCLSNRAAPSFNILPSFKKESQAMTAIEGNNMSGVDGPRTCAFRCDSEQSLQVSAEFKTDLKGDS
jgi:hypothetical protein